MSELETPVVDAQADPADAGPESAVEAAAEAPAGSPAEAPAADAPTRASDWPPDDPDAPAFDVRISRDQVMVVLDCPDPLLDAELVAIRIVEKFVELKLPEYPDRELVVEILRNVAVPGAHLRDQPLIMGAEPVPPRDGALEWARDFFATGWEVDAETGAMNFWERAARGSVAEGEVIARLLPPVAGTPGLNVYGKPIGVGKPQQARMRAGKGVMDVDEGGVRLLKASVAGRVRLQSGVVTVDDVYAVRGDVCLETGNIHHTGSVTIGGDIKAGALVEADGDIVVKGMLEPCTIRCGGTLNVAGGIIGGEGCTITVGGELHARYVSEATIRCGGDVHVQGEVKHSVVETTGRVLVPEGRIAGGSTIAWKGIRVGEAGASGSAKTVLVAGVDPTLPERTGELRERMRKAVAARQRVTEAINEAAGTGRLNDGQRATIEALRAKLDELAQTHAEAARGIEEMEQQAAAEGVPEIVMFKEVWSGTTIHLGDEKLVVRSSVLKPRLAQLKQSGAVLLPLGEGNMPSD
ncbi:MAG TPA: FapA family protein [Candidatus Krumholzibacteria bacterium]|nr:FapA family protein [Candidatus Krumholzibacteria bacterium]